MPCPWHWLHLLWPRLCSRKARRAFKTVRPTLGCGKSISQPTQIMIWLDSHHYLIRTRLLAGMCWNRLYSHHSHPSAEQLSNVTWKAYVAEWKATSSIYRHLHEMLKAVYPLYDIVIWSANSLKWMEVKLRQLGLTNNQDYRITCLLDCRCMVPVRTEKRGRFSSTHFNFVYRFPCSNLSSVKMCQSCLRLLRMGLALYCNSVL